MTTGGFFLWLRHELLPGDDMIIFRIGILLSALLAMAASANAGGDLVQFPENYEKDVLYAIVDRPDNKQYRELYATAPAIEAAKAGRPLPDGTVLTLVQYNALLDSQGNPQKNAEGRFIKGTRIGYTVMEKRAGWGAEYPEAKRNGEWEYQAFTLDKKVNEKANLNACFTCHKPLDKQDFVFSYDRMKASK
jgi:Cytochrome P460